MTYTYAIGDLHGRADVLEACITLIEKHRIARGDETGEQTTVVFLGDYIDRGKNSRAVIERLMAGSQDKSKWVILQGNHELMALMAHADPDMYWKWWCDNGGLQTSMNYEDRRMPLDQLQWMNTLPVSHRDAYRLFVHAGVKKDVTLEHHTEEMMLWVRHKRDEEVPLKGSNLYVVHGHTPFMDGPVVLNTRCNLDCGSYRTGTQPIAVFDDAQAGKPVEMLTARAGYAVDPKDWTTW